jgi:ribokinase
MTAADPASGKASAVSRQGPIVVAGAHGQSLFLRVDAVPREGETVLGSGFDEPEDGGKATNQAVAIAKLGVPARFVTVVGTDERGRRWRGIMERYGIDTRYVREVEGATDVGFVMLPPSGIPAIATSCELSLLLDDALVRSCADAYSDAAVVICQFEAPQSCAAESFRLARAAGAITILNPAPAQALDDELLDLVDVLVPNQHEAALLDGAATDPSDLSARLRARYGCAVVVTAGAGGCYCADPMGLRAHFPAPALEVTDTTGAGDAFVGALAVGLREGNDLGTAAAFATQAASLSVTRPGTMPSYPTRTELPPTSSVRAPA